MVEITPFHDRLALEVKGWHKLWALKSRLEIPLEHIKGVHADPHPAMGWFQGMKLAGTDIPHIFRAGLFYQEGNKVFWDVRHPAQTIVIDLEDESVAKLIVEVEDPEASVQVVLEIMRNYQAAKAAAEAELDQALENPLSATVRTPFTSTTQKHPSEISEQEISQSSIS
jgi:hypothetical protein